MKNRIFYIELLRIIACFAVIVLHSINNILPNALIYGTNTWKLANFINVITRFAVPVFFMISGYLAFSSTKEYSIKDFLQNKFITLVVPLFAYSLFYYIFLNTSGKLSVSDFLFKFISMDVQYHLWFMYALIGLELLVPVLKKAVQSLDNKGLFYFWLISIFPTTVGPFLNKVLKIWLFRYESLIFGYFGYFLLGYIVGKIDIQKKNRILIYLNGLAWAFISYFGTIYLSSSERIDLFFNGGYQINSYFIAIAIFVFAKYNFKETANKFFNNAVLKIARLTFDIYLIHAFVLSLLQNYTNAGHIISLTLLSIPTFLISLVLAFGIYIIKEKCQ